MAPVGEQVKAATPPTAPAGKDLKKVDSDDWSVFDVNKWRSAIASTRSYFKQLYIDTNGFVQNIIQDLKTQYPDSKVRLIEVGSGTGEFLFSALEAGTVDHAVGVEYNQKFVTFCNERHDADYQDHDLVFLCGDAQELVKVLEDANVAPKRDEIVVIACVNNTFGIMNDEVRANVYAQIVEAMHMSPEKTVFLAGYWDGNLFGHSVQNFYGSNPLLCGGIKDAEIDWENNIMTTTSGYVTRWTTPQQAYDRISALGLDVTRIEARSRGVLVDARLPRETTGKYETRELTTSSEKVSQDYYDSEDAFNFYSKVWGGDNIHIGAYDESVKVGETDLAEQVRLASEHVLELLASKVDIKDDWKVMDMGSALGGCSRYLARTFGCHVVGVDLSKKECEMNIKKTTRAGLSHLVEVKCCSFTDTGYESGSFDLIVSEDSFLHAGKFRADCLKEASRLLRPGGFMVFTDPMQADVVDTEKLAPIYNRIHLDDMGSVAFYKKAAREHGLEFVSFDQMTHNLITHYSTVQQVLRQKRDELIKDGMNASYIDNMDKGLTYWVEGGKAGLLNYGILVFRKPETNIADLAKQAQQAADAAFRCAQMAQKLADASLMPSDSSISGSSTE